jgi:hypothetical protein
VHGTASRSRRQGKHRCAVVNARSLGPNISGSRVVLCKETAAIVIFLPLNSIAM